MSIEVKRGLRLTPRPHGPGKICHALLIFHITVTKRCGYKEQRGALTPQASRCRQTERNAHEDDFSYPVLLFIRNCIIFFRNCKTRLQSPGKLPITGDFDCFFHLRNVLKSCIVTHVFLVPFSEFDATFGREK